MSLKGPFIMISGPSGVGKTLFIKRSLTQLPQFSNTVSFTTRSLRKGEKNGEFYYFVTKEEFEQRRDQGDLLEWAKVHNEFYGTSIKEVQRIWQEGKAILKDIDVQGCRSIKKIFPHSVSVFIYPPSVNELKNRILKRGSLSKEDLDTRLSMAVQEMAQGREYDFKIVNDSFDESLAEFQKFLFKV